MVLCCACLGPRQDAGLDLSTYQQSCHRVHGYGHGHGRGRGHGRGHDRGHGRGHGHARVLAQELRDGECRRPLGS